MCIGFLCSLPIHLTELQEVLVHLLQVVGHPIGGEVAQGAASIALGHLLSTPTPPTDKVTYRMSRGRRSGRARSNKSRSQRSRNQSRRTWTKGSKTRGRRSTRSRSSWTNSDCLPSFSRQYFQHAPLALGI